jgi:NAD(P)-dependent dehydrogenase (short-subunit alcohol dehydrogenase family)
VSERGLALVTGAAGGIGLEVVRRLVDRGYEVIAVERNDDLAVAAAASSGGAVPVVCDLSSREDVARLVARIEGEWAARLEIVVCNAGVIVPGDVVDTDPAELDLQLDVMLTSVAHVVTAAARVFVAKDRGHVVATVSHGGIVAMPGSAAYSAAKAGLRAYLSALSAELRHTRVAVSGIYPSAVDTPMLRHEATHGGSLLNFVGSVSPVSKVADTFDRALRTKKLELYHPYGDGVLSRFLQCFPWMLPRLLGPLEWMGQRGLKKYLATEAVSS